MAPIGNISRDTRGFGILSGQGTCENRTPEQLQAMHDTRCVGQLRLLVSRHWRLSWGRHTRSQHRDAENARQPDCNPDIKDEDQVSTVPGTVDEAAVTVPGHESGQTLMIS